MLDGIVLHVTTFVAFTGSVAIATWFICRNFVGSNGSASDDYFAGGRALKWYYCAGSLMLTNLSTEQLVGLNGNVFADGCLSAIWWEAGAAIAMVITATVFLPRYMALGLTTTSGFLGERYDLSLRTLISVIFLLYYSLVLCPLVLYTGGLAIKNIFDLSVPLWTVSTTIGVIGSAYALFGGVKAIAVSDTLNGIGLIVAGLWVPIAALQKLPGGLSGLFEHGDGYLPSLVARSNVTLTDAGVGMRNLGVPSVPWHVTFTGLFLSNMYYWSTNQVILQRALAAESLSNSQKGVLFSAMMKVVGFSFLCIPGLIGILFVQLGVEIDGKQFSVRSPDEVYPELVKSVLPKWALGFFSAVLIGSCLSTFNAALNSSATIFGLEIYKIYVNPHADEIRTVRVANIFGACLALVTFVIAPFLIHVSSIFPYLQRVNTIVSLPILTAFFVGIASPCPDAFAAKVGVLVAVVAVVAGQWVPAHFLHVFFGSFLIAVAAMAVAMIPCIRRMFGQEPHPKPYASSGNDQSLVDMTPWRPMYVVCAGIVMLLVWLLVSLQLASFELFIAFCAAWTLVLVGLLAWPPTKACHAGPQQQKNISSGNGSISNEMVECSSAPSDSIPGVARA